MESDACKHLVVDTSLFSPDFQTRLLSALSALSDSQSLDTTTDGILIHSDNFQALNLLQARYREQVKCIYIDPPYNTSASEILYKNGYKHSSWLSLMEDRLSKAKKLLRSDGIQCLTVDDFEYHVIKEMLDREFNNYLGTIAIKNNPSGRSTASGISISHEYAVFHSLGESSYIGRLGRTEEQKGRYKEKDINGFYEWVNFRKHGGVREDAPSMYYPIFINKETLGFRIPSMSFDRERFIYNIDEECGANEIIVYPIDENGVQRRWKWGVDRFSSQLSEICIKKDRLGNLTPYIKSRMNEQGVLPLTVWDKKEYSSTSYGTNILKNIIGDLNSFSYPKSIHAVEDCLRVLNLSVDETILDYFAGSGTTAHAVINLNREDGGKRKYILVEQGEYFDTVLKPRVQKVVYSQEWKDGKPVADKDSGSLNGVSQMVKVLKLESYEDTLNNLLLQNKGDLLSGLPENAQQDYLLHYMLDLESRDSLLNTDVFKKPFDYRLNIASDSAGAYTETAVDLVETFNYLIGLRVQAVEDKRFTEGYVLVEGWIKSPSEKILLVWRDCERWDYDKLPKLLDKKRVNPQDAEFDAVYINGDHTLPTVWQSDDAVESRTLKIMQIEAEFLRLMFEEA